MDPVRLGEQHLGSRRSSSVENSVTEMNQVLSQRMVASAESQPAGEGPLLPPEAAAVQVFHAATVYTAARNAQIAARIHDEM